MFDQLEKFNSRRVEVALPNDIETANVQNSFDQHNNAGSEN